MATDRTKDRFREIEELARAAGLKHYDVQFFEVPTSVIYEVASYGLPTRYSHWSFGRTFQFQKTRGEMGHSKIYELVLNNNPCYAFLDSSNTETINLMIAAHVFGHADFFANNIMFREAQEENMVQVAKRHAEAIDQYRRDYGDDEVDEWLDVALGMEHHIDVYKKLRRARYEKRHVEFHGRKIGEWEDLHPNDDPLVKKVVEGAYLPPQPEKDLLWFFAEYANMEDWQKRIFEIVRRESYYFYPQYRTKCLNEGWACLSGDSKILTEEGLINISDYTNINYEKVKCHSGTKFVRRTDIHVTDKKEGVCIRTNRCTIFRCALNHRVKLASGEFKKAKDLQINDRLMMSIGQNSWSNEYQKVNVGYTKKKCATLNTKEIESPVVIDEEFAQFIAFWLGEGCIYKDRGIFIRNKDKKQLIELSNFILDRFGINSSIQTTDLGKVSERYNLEIYSISLFSLLNVITGDIKRKSRQKRIPDIIFKSPRTVVSAFLQYLFDAEGCCYVSEDAKQKVIVLASSSLDMLNDVSILLSNLGIYGAYAVCKKDGYEDTHQLRIGSKCCRKFQHEINFKNAKKNAKLIKLLSLSSVHKCDEDECKVIGIEKIEDVFFDFTVPKSHTYVADGIVHHNSYWHAELMLQYSLGDDNDYGVKGIKYPLTSEEHLDFLSSHEKVVQSGVKIPLKVEQPELDDNRRPTGRTIKGWHPRIVENPNLFHHATRINPYYVGFRMFRDIKRRWDEYFEEGFYEDEWGKKIPVTINGNQKIRQVMESEDDVSFFRNYLTEDLCDELHLFAFGSPEEYNDNYKIQEEIKKRTRENGDRHLGNFPIDEQLKINKTVQVRTKDVDDIVRTIARTRNNYGVPCIVVRRVDSDGTLRLEHVKDDLTNVDTGYGEHILRYIFRVWGRPVELIRKNVDHTHVMKYDASGFSLDYATSDYPESIEENDVASSW